MKYLIFFTLIFFFNVSFAQHDTLVNFRGKIYHAFQTLDDARKVHPDSVYALVLASQSLKDFPIEITKYKNLEYLSFDSYMCKNVQHLLTKKELKAFNKEYKKRPLDYNPVYKTNKIVTIPKEIGNLKNLRLLELGNVSMDYLKWKDTLDKYLPNTKRDY